jgi:surfeit locus 1 family protein
VTSRVRRLLVPTLSTAVMLAVLLALGTWQVKRLHWKLGILHQIARAEAQPPVPLGPTPAPFTKISVAGSFRPGAIAYYGSETGNTTHGLMLGAQQIAVLERPGALPILVDRGWVPLPPDPANAPPAGSATVTGYIHAPSTPGPFSAADDPKARRFYTLAPATIARALGLPAVAPFAIIAMGETPPGGAPNPAHHLPRPPNNHLEYAMTWYGFAITLLVFFVLYTRKVLRS